MIYGWMEALCELEKYIAEQDEFIEAAKLMDFISNKRKEYEESFCCFLPPNWPDIEVPNPNVWNISGKNDVRETYGGC